MWEKTISSHHEEYGLREILTFSFGEIWVNTTVRFTPSKSVGETAHAICWILFFPEGETNSMKVYDDSFIYYGVSDRDELLATKLSQFHSKVEEYKNLYPNLLKGGNL